LRLRAALLALACFTTAHAETRPHHVGKVQATLLGSPATFDPGAAQSHAELTIVELLFDTLYRIQPSGQVEPLVATELPELDAAKTTAKITIQKGIRFHDGSPMTAQHVAASLERVRNAGGKWALAAIAAVKATGDSIEITLRTPTPDLATMLALPPAAITKPGQSANTFVGSGPFVVESIDLPNRRLVLKQFEEYFGGRPYLDRLVLDWYDTPDGEARRFETGDAQFSARGVAVFANGTPKYKAAFVDAPTSLLLFVGFGKKHADITSDPAFRHALDLALDRGALTSVNKGETIAVAGEPVPVEAGGAPPTALVRDGDVTQAKAMLARSPVKALATTALPAVKLEITFETTRPDDLLIAERVARALNKLGIGSTLNPVPATTLRTARATTDLWIGQLAAPITIAWPWWSQAFSAGGDDWAATKLAAGGFAPAAAQKEFAQRLPIVPLMFRGIRLWHRTDIRGLRFDASGRPCFAELFLFGQPRPP
jgi:peptide/nickel transport system substrate-binding protein